MFIKELNEAVNLVVAVDDDHAPALNEAMLWAAKERLEAAIAGIVKRIDEIVAAERKEYHHNKPSKFRSVWPGV